MYFTKLRLDAKLKSYFFWTRLCAVGVRGYLPLSGFSRFKWVLRSQEKRLRDYCFGLSANFYITFSEVDAKKRVSFEMILGYEFGNERLCTSYRDDVGSWEEALDDILDELEAGKMKREEYYHSRYK
jgi:hypothetical protein